MPELKPQGLSDDDITVIAEVRPRPRTQRVLQQRVVQRCKCGAAFETNPHKDADKDEDGKEEPGKEIEKE